MPPGKKTDDCINLTEQNIEDVTCRPSPPSALAFLPNLPSSRLLAEPRAAAPPRTAKPSPHCKTSRMKFLWASRSQVTTPHELSGYLGRKVTSETPDSPSKRSLSRLFPEHRDFTAGARWESPGHARSRLWQPPEEDSWAIYHLNLQRPCALATPGPQLVLSPGIQTDFSRRAWASLTA